MIPYPAALALHVAALILFLGGFFLVALVPGVGGEAELRRLDRWNLAVTMPALALVWAAGLTMALEAGWFASGWLKLKLACVVVLTVLQIGQTVRLHRRAATAPAARRLVAAAAAFLVLLIFFLVAAKPF